MLTLKQMEEMKELSIPSIVLSTKKSVLLLIGKAKYKLFSEDNGVVVLDARFSANQLCHAYRLTPSEYILHE